MKWAAPAFGLRSRSAGPLRGLCNDALYRGSLILLTNTVATSAIGFVFWSLAARRYPANALGVFSGVTSGAGLLAAIAALGLPNVITRHIASERNSRQLVIMAAAAIGTVGAALCVATVLVLGPHLPAALHLRQTGGLVLLVTVLVVFTAISGTLDAGLVAVRSSHAVLVKNVAGSIVKVAAMLVLVSFRSWGLLIAFALGLVVTTVIGGVSLGRRTGGQRAGFGSLRLLRRYLSLTSGNYLATIFGMLPLGVVPILVLVMLGATAAGRFAVAFLIAGFLNIIPSTVAQVLFAEASRERGSLREQLRKAIRGVYGLLLPPLIIVVVAAPLLLRIFGPAYAAAATGCLRVLALSALLTGGTYLIDALLIAQDRVAAYVFMNGVNAALVLGLVGVLLPRGLTAGAVGWAVAQGLSLLIGLIVLATGRPGRPHRGAAAAPSGMSLELTIGDVADAGPGTEVAKYLFQASPVAVLIDLPAVTPEMVYPAPAQHAVEHVPGQSIPGQIAQYLAGPEPGETGDPPGIKPVAVGLHRRSGFVGIGQAKLVASHRAGIGIPRVLYQLDVRIRVRPVRVAKAADSLTGYPFQRNPGVENLVPRPVFWNFWQPGMRHRMGTNLEVAA